MTKRFETTWVVALDPAAFDYWCAIRGINPLGPYYRYVKSVKDFTGRTDLPLLFIPNWEKRDDAPALELAARIVGRTPFDGVQIQALRAAGVWTVPEVIRS